MKKHVFINGKNNFDNLPSKSVIILLTILQTESIYKKNIRSLHEQLKKELYFFIPKVNFHNLQLNEISSYLIFHLIFLSLFLIYDHYF